LAYFVYFHFRWGGKYRHICPQSVAKAKIERDPSVVWPFQGVDYDLYLHYAIGHLPRADGALPDFADGAKTLDFFHGNGEHRYILSIFYILCILCILYVYYFVLGISSIRISLFMGFG
jgi:hypothetical protein